MRVVTRLAPPLAILAALAPTSARGHHPESGASSVLPSTATAVEIGAGGFDVGGQRGEWQSITLALELAPWRRASLAVRIPTARLAFRDGHTPWGLGDASVAAKVALYRGARAQIVAGIGCELPTGSKADGLGGGHVELAPFVVAATAWSVGEGGRVSLRGGAEQRLSLSSDAGTARSLRHGALNADGAHGSPLAPHAQHELATSLLVGYHSDGAHAAAGLEVAWILADGGATSPWFAGAQAGVELSPRARLGVGLDLPIAGTERFTWRGRIWFAWLFR